MLGQGTVVTDALIAIFTPCICCCTKRRLRWTPSKVARPTPPAVLTRVGDTMADRGLPAAAAVVHAQGVMVANLAAPPC